jgi:hypothetical protein
MGIVFGFGINDADYPVTRVIGGREVSCRAYKAWKNMIERSYSQKFHARCPTYVGVSVCEEWRSFMAFRSWWVENHVDGWQLDKDLLSDCGVYSPETCIYIPGWLNKFTIGRNSKRGEWPIGVSFDKRRKRYKAACRNPLSGKGESLGLFRNPIDAHQAWVSRKIEIADTIKSRMDSIDVRIHPRVIEIIRMAT